jgi:hypothetical protein
METWKSQDVPLHIVLRGIEKSFDSFEAKPRKRTVKSLLYCQEEVEAQYAEWIESRVGANPESQVGAVAEDNDRTPFSSVAIKDHLVEKRQQLTKIAGSVTAGDTVLAESMLRAVRILEDLEEEQENSATVETRKLEDSLTGLERLLNEAMLSASGSELDQLKAEVKAQLKPYRAHMEKSAYQQTFDNLLLKRVRERFNVPRLSLFYL